MRGLRIRMPEDTQLTDTFESDVLTVVVTQL